MKNKRQSKICTYKNINIYYQFNNGDLIGENKETGEIFKGKYLFELQNKIDEPTYESCEEWALGESGYFDRDLCFIKANRKNIKNNEFEWKIVKDTDRNFDNGKEYRGRTYPLTEKNKIIFHKIEDLNKEINKIEGQKYKLLEDMDRNNENKQI